MYLAPDWSTLYIVAAALKSVSDRRARRAPSSVSGLLVARRLSDPCVKGQGQALARCAAPGPPFLGLLRLVAIGSAAQARELKAERKIDANAPVALWTAVRPRMSSPV